MQPAYDRMLAAYYDRMEGMYDRMQMQHAYEAAYDRMHPACSLHTIVCMGSTLEHTPSDSHL